MNMHLLKRLAALALLTALGAAAQPAAPADMLRSFADEAFWQKRATPPAVTRDDLVKSVEGLRVYMLNHQYTAGNFLYAENVRKGEFVTDEDNQVRQAGAFWGITTLLRERPNEATRRAVMLCLDFFCKNRLTIPDGKFIIKYPGENTIKTGAVALFCLGLTEFLYSQDKFLPQDLKEEYAKILDMHLAFLRSMELADGSWGCEYDPASNVRSPEALSYYDGEALLAYCKAARYLGKTDLLPRILEATPKLALKYTADCWKPGFPGDFCKGFSQWGCMSFAEYVEAGWEKPEIPILAAKALALWALYDNSLKTKSGNISYAVEGLIGSWRVASATGDSEWAAKLKKDSLDILGTLQMMQIGNTYSKRNQYLAGLSNIPTKAFGGTLNAMDSDFVRIDTVQHQAHATLQALKYLLPEK